MADADLAITTNTTWQLSPEYSEASAGDWEGQPRPIWDISSLVVFENMSGFAVVGLAGQVSLNSKGFRLFCGGVLNIVRATEYMPHSVCFPWRPCGFESEWHYSSAAVTSLPCGARLHPNGSSGLSSPESGRRPSPPQLLSWLVAFKSQCFPQSVCLVNIHF